MAELYLTPHVSNTTGSVTITVCCYEHRSHPGPRYGWYHVCGSQNSIIWARGRNRVQRYLCFIAIHPQQMNGSQMEGGRPAKPHSRGDSATQQKMQTNRAAWPISTNWERIQSGSKMTPCLRPPHLGQALDTRKGRRGGTVHSSGHHTRVQETAEVVQGGGICHGMANPAPSGSSQSGCTYANALPSTVGSCQSCNLHVAWPTPAGPRPRGLQSPTS